MFCARGCLLTKRSIIQKLAILALMAFMIVMPASIVPIYSLTTEDRNDRECITEHMKSDIIPPRLARIKFQVAEE
jgi:hypothetical protein